MLVITIAVLDSTHVFRLARALAMNIAVSNSSRRRGCAARAVVDHHARDPAQCDGAADAEFGLRFCFTFLFIAALSFLGLGVQPPDADWGSMVTDNRDMINFGSAAPLYPAVAIALLTVGINLVVDWLLSMTAAFRRAGRRRVRAAPQNAR